MIVVWRILSFTIPIPIILILGLAAWVQFDKSSAIRQAVNDYVKEMVAGAEIAALEARLDAKKKISAARGQVAAEANRRLMAEINARVNLSRRLAAIQTENEILNDDLADLLSRPVPRDCVVDPDLLGGLRAK